MIKSEKDKKYALELKNLMDGDIGEDHSVADGYVSEILQRLGYIELADTYDNLCIKFWYS